MITPCPVCGCTASAGSAAHAISAALRDDDVDRAIDAGLLVTGGCLGCDRACHAALVAARDARLSALGARERHRARNARLQRRAAERTAQRLAPAAAPPATPAASTATPRAPLPSAAAAALARAKTRAARSRKQ